MDKRAAGRTLWLWGVVALLCGIAVVGLATHFGPLGYRPYYSLAMLLRDPLDIGRILPSSLHDSKFQDRRESVLICPRNICAAAEKIDVQPPIFNMSAEILIRRLDSIIMAEPGAGAAYLPPGDPLVGRYILRPAPLALPETIDLIVIPIDDSHATFALYARGLIRELTPDRSERTARWIAALHDAN